MNSKPEDVGKLLDEFKSESRALKKQLIEICFFMRGSINWDQAWNLDYNYRNLIMKQININIENTKKSGMPLL